MASYEIFKSKIERNEGGFQKLPNDFGNYNSKNELVGTNHGVSAIVYEEIIGRPPTEAEMRAITKQEAHKIFKTRFWDKLNADFINSQKVADMLADHGINSYPTTAAKIIQRVLNKYFSFNLAIDGVIGKNTLKAINSVNDEELFIVLAQARIHAYTTYRKCDDFCHVWHNRVRYLANFYGINIEKEIAPSKKKR